ncbi:MAG TPA: PepSY-associated TM helix domain-containing protein [Allosphingosinicella sp.]|nr:PepSY-associated TM helix domain-containing protein [Allosphingosinicella sp.]
MARSTTMRLRALWLQVHKWIGLSLAILIIPISITGAALVWHDWLDAQINPQRYAATSSEALLTPGQYAAAARPAIKAAAPAGEVAQIRYPEGGDGPVLVSGTRPQPGDGGGRPARTNVWLDPASGNVLDSASSGSGLVQVMHVLHGSMMVPVWGRTIVGWVGVFMFVSCLTGIWLWWPITGSVRRGFRWKRQNSTNANLHHRLGFWILLPLAMLSFTGFWISFPSVFNTFEASQPKAKGEGAPGGPGRAPPAPLANPATSADAALAAAQSLSGGGRLISITWPVANPRKVEWKFQFAREGGPAEVAVDDASGRASPPPPPGAETNRQLMRRLHDGTGLGPIWQTVIFLGGIIPAILAVTGIIMWLRSRGWRRKLASKRKARRGPGEMAPQAAE